MRHIFPILILSYVTFSLLVGSISSIVEEIGGGFHDFAPHNSVTRDILHHFLFNQCIAIDNLGNVLLVDCLLSSSPTSSVSWHIKTILLYEFVFVSPDIVFKKGWLSFCGSLHKWFCVCLFVCLFVDIFISHMIVCADVQDYS